MQELPAHIERQISPEPNSGCWLWTGHLADGKYGCLSYKNKTYIAHRFIYRWIKGEIPKPLELDHLCKLKCCVNPDHLEPVTSRENKLRAHRNAFCKHGHEMTEANSFHWKGLRFCRTCKRKNCNTHNHKRRA